MRKGKSLLKFSYFSSFLSLHLKSNFSIIIELPFSFLIRIVHFIFCLFIYKKLNDCEAVKQILIYSSICIKPWRA